jgi:hypothetical protein
MLKTRILYQLNSDNSGEILDNINAKTVQINRNGLIFIIQIVSSKPIGILNEKQKQK